MGTKDICLNCGAELEYASFGAMCSCSAPSVVHQQPCDGCGRMIGQLTDDDYCGPEKLYCPGCLDDRRGKKIMDNARLADAHVKQMKTLTDEQMRQWAERVEIACGSRMIPEADRK